MRGFILRFTSTSILGVLVALTVTGVYGLIWFEPGWVMEIHRIASWALIALIPWKIGISWRSLKRGLAPRFDRSVMIGVSLLLATLLFSIVLFGLQWTWRIGPQELWLRQTTLGWHWIFALLILIPLGLHVWRRWPRPKPEEFTSRRGALRLIGYGAFGLVAWQAAEAIAKTREEQKHPRRITGSRGDGEFTGNDFPITSEAAPDIHIDMWSLAVEGAVASPFRLNYEQLLSLPHKEVVAMLDCTNGWWTTQSWGGVTLASLLATAQLKPEAIAVRLNSLTNYGQVFTLAEAQQILIATHVGSEALEHWHGLPARAVVPFRRGWFWVKWLSTISVLNNVGQILEQPFSIR